MRASPRQSWWTSHAQLLSSQHAHFAQDLPRPERNFLHALNVPAGGPFATCAGLIGGVMYRDSLLDELGRVERDVVEGERQLAEQEMLLVALKRQNEDTGKASALLETMRENQRRREQERQRLLALLQR
jgi:hypothetical protein